MIDDQTLSQFGIKLEDEYPHPYSEDHQDWNESYFFDWYDLQGKNAGHCRIGWHPVQKRILFWLYLYNGKEWLVIEEYRLPFSELLLQQNDIVFSYQGWGLNFSFKIQSPLKAGTLEVSGFARVISGERQGMILPVSLKLDFQVKGPAHSRGAGTVDDHSAKGFNTNRYEQPIEAKATVVIDQETENLVVYGERDHSWGPRPWDMQWQFFVINTEQFCLQSTTVNIPDWPPIQMGYYQASAEKMENLETVEFKLDFNADEPANAVSGSFNLICDSGRAIRGTIETISGTEIDITHTFAEPKRTEYRRSLVRCIIEGKEAVVGWLESNRLTDEKKDS